MALVTVQDFKDYLKITSTERDQLLTTILAESEATINDWLGRTLGDQSITEDFSGNGTNRAILKNRPITAVTQVLVSISGASEISSSGYEFFADQGIVELLASVFPVGIKNCRVVYRAGYTKQTVPASIQLAIKELGKLIFDGSPAGDNRLGKTTLNQQSAGTTSYVDELPDRTKRMLSRYRNLSF